MERIPRQFYTQEFKEEAVALVVDSGLTVAEVGRRLSISHQTLRNWIKKHRSTGLTNSSHSVSELEAEVSRLRKELAEARLEKEILKRLWRTLQRSRGEVRDDRRATAGTRVSRRADVQYSRRIEKRLLCLAGA